MRKPCTDPEVQRNIGITQPVLWLRTIQPKNGNGNHG